jgi:pyruvate,orthophosphate dikinase
VARQLDKVCLVDCRALVIDIEHRRIRLGDHSFAEGDMLTLDGEAGDVYAGKVPTRREQPTSAIEVIRRWQSSEMSTSQNGNLALPKTIEHR